MKTQKFKRTVSLLLAMLMCVTTLFGMGTTAFAAEETEYILSPIPVTAMPTTAENGDTTA